MNKKLVSLAALFLIGASLSYGAESGDWKGWYKGFLRSLKAKIEKRVTPKSKITAVAAVRGARQEDKSAKVYWKGSTSHKAQEKIDQDRKTIKEAVENIVEGDLEKGRTQLSEFVRKNPDSYFIAEAKEALEKLPAKEGGAPGVKPEGGKSPEPEKKEVKEEKPVESGKE